LALLATIVLGARVAFATPPTPGFPEPVVQWGVQKGETCEDIARTLWGSPKLAPLVQRYNHVACKVGAPLREGLTLVLPETPTTLPDARLRSMNPDVRARPGGGAWSPAASGMPLYSNYNVNTLDKGRADVEFIDRTRVFLAPNTLVVLYGTANQTRVSHTAPAVVEVEAGEVKAGLAALRGGGSGVPLDAPLDAIEVATKDGGRVSAASRDTVVQRKGDRTTVEVFDGKAGVTSAGKSVEVPKNFGTRFVRAAPPAPPRPLPAAPAWVAAGTTGSVLVAKGDAGRVTAAWEPAASASQYRIELAREVRRPDGATDLEIITRDEVPASVTSFRGELAAGNYRIAVRVIDKEEYLGVAAELPFQVTEAEIKKGTGAVTPKAIEVNPYGEIQLTPNDELELAIDDGPFGPMATHLDLRKRAPRELRLRRRGATTFDTVPVRYTDVKAVFDPAPAVDHGTLSVHARLEGVTGIDVTDRVQPVARVRVGGAVRTVPLAVGAGGALVGTMVMPPGEEVTRVDVADGRGVVLGTATVAPPADVAVPAVRVGHRLFGALAPLWQASPATDVLWLAPTPADGAIVSAGLVRGASAWAVQGQVRASGSIGPVGLDAAVRSDTSDAKTALASAWLGARWRVLRLDGDRFELAPALRVGVPASAAGLPPQLEPALLAGGAAGMFTWVVDAGGRARLAADTNATGTPKGQAYLLGGGTFEALAWLHVNALLDAHVVIRDPGSGSSLGLLGGLGAGIELGTVVYGGLALRVSPLHDPASGVFMGQLALGFRGGP
jgi:hypothetical protein